MKKDNYLIGLGVFLNLKIKMLFFLKKSLIVEESCKEFLDICQAVRNLATAACERKHFITGDIDTILYFAKIFKEQTHDKVAIYFDNLKKNYATLGIPRFITYYIEVVNSNIYNEIEENGKKIFQIDYKEFEDTQSVQKTVLICEDGMYDCLFYKYILQWYIKVVLNKNSIPCEFDNRHGGGAQTYLCLDSCIKNKLTSLCIIDSDKKYPEQKIERNSTCKKCQNIKCGPRNYCYILNCQEIENLIPLNFIDSLNFSGNLLKRKKALDELKNNPNVEIIIQYLDLKEGLKKYKKYKKDANFILFVKYFYPSISKIKNIKKIEKYYISRDDNDELYPGIMEDLLKHVIEDENSKLIQRNIIRPHLLQFQVNEWNKIGQMMLNFGFARNQEGLSN